MSDHIAMVSALNQWLTLALVKTSDTFIYVTQMYLYSISS